MTHLTRMRKEIIMAYYDQFTQKPRSPRDDWRDDEETLRPERDG